jgi:tetratricopeptide (TPR) repeat protein
MNMQLSDTHYLHLKPTSSKLLIILSATGTKAGRFNLWGLRDKIPHNILFLRVAENDWYQNGVSGLANSHEGTISAIKSIVSKNDIKEVYTCGSSMGGWAAIFYGAELNCNALAFSPEILLKLPHSRSAKMMPVETTVRFHDIRNKIEGSKSLFYIYTGERDPVDLYCADLVKDFENVEVTTFPNDEHTVLRTLVSNGQFLPMLWLFMSGSKINKQKDAGRALNYEGFAENYYFGWSAYQSKDNDNARAFLEIALSKYAAASHAQYIMGSLLYRHKDFSKGKDYMLMALALRPDIPEHHVGVAQYFRRIGLLDDAIRMHLDIQSRWPESYQSRYELAMIYIEIDDKQQAISQLKEVVRLQPKRKAYKDALSKLQ